MILKYTGARVALLKTSYQARREALRRFSRLIGNNLKRDNAIVSVLELRYGVDRWVPGQLPIARIAHFHASIFVGIQQETGRGSRGRRLRRLVGATGTARRHRSYRYDDDCQVHSRFGAHNLPSTVKRSSMIYVVVLSQGALT